MIALKNNLGSEFVERVRAFFSENGPLSKAKNFEFRPQQQEMAVRVAQALEEEQHLIVEAGTGVGKSLGYLVPSVLFASPRARVAERAGTFHRSGAKRIAAVGRMGADNARWIAQRSLGRARSKS